MAIPKKLVLLVLERDNYRCQIALPGCLGEASVADHRATRGMGGAKVLNRASLLIAACGLCNSAREDTSGEVRARLIERGVIVLADATHAKTSLRGALTPFTDPAGVSWWLDDYGGKERTDDPIPF